MCLYITVNEPLNILHSIYPNNGESQGEVDRWITGNYIEGEKRGKKGAYEEIWTLYCTDRNSRWHLYWEYKPAKNLDELLEEIDEDPTGIFWG